MRKRKGTRRILAFILCLLMIFCSIDLSVMEVQASNDTTIIDVTGLASGAETSHDCSKYLTTKYNSTQHWQECTVCGKVYGNKHNHSFVTTGTAGCNAGLGYQYKSCTCGYSYQLPKTPHTATGWIACTDRSGHFKRCTVCDVWSSYGKCVNAYGQELGCKTGISGTCIYCGSYRYGWQHGLVDSNQTSYSVSGTTITRAGNLVCQDCGQILGNYSVTTYRLSENQSKAVLNATTYFNIPSVNISSGNCSNIEQNGVNFQVTAFSQSGNNLYAEAIVTHNKNNLAPGDYEIHFATNGFYNSSFVGNIAGIHMSGVFRADWNAPTCIGNYVNYYNYVSPWNTKAILTANYSESYSSNCYVRLLDSDRSTVISNWGAAVANGTTFTKNIDITDEVNGSKILYLQAKDTAGNVSGLTPVTIQNLDSKPPTVTSSSSTSTEWSKTKNYTAQATDLGAGDVQVAFNNVSEYRMADKSGTSYSRNYKFTGDVYGSVIAAIYYKDSVGNETTKFIRIYNLDNTAPTITNITGEAVADEKVKFTISANDNKDFGGSVGIKSGSGVNSYAISSSNTAPTDGWQTSNEIYVDTPGTYYVFAKDAVGNISAPYEIKVMTLTIDFNDGEFNGDTSSKVFLGATCGSKATHTFNIKQYYGTLKGNGYNSKGLNNNLTKTDADGIQYRFLGYSLNPNATVPDANFDVYANSTRTENYTISDNTTIYAVWEPVLQMTVQISAPSHSGMMQLTSDVPVNTALGNFKILSGTKNTDLLSSGTASVNSATIGANVTNEDLVRYTVSAKGNSDIKFSTAADSRILDIYNHGKNNPWFDKLNEAKDFNYSIDAFLSATSSFTIPQYLGTSQSYQTSNPDLSSGSAVYGIKFTCTQPSYYYNKYWHGDESVSVYCILFLQATDLDGSDDGRLPPYAVEAGMYTFQTILN